MVQALEAWRRWLSDDIVAWELYGAAVGFSNKKELLNYLDMWRYNSEDEAGITEAEHEAINFFSLIKLPTVIERWRRYANCRLVSRLHALSGDEYWGGLAAKECLKRWRYYRLMGMVERRAFRKQLQFRHVLKDQSRLAFVRWRESVQSVLTDLWKLHAAMGCVALHRHDVAWRRWREMYLEGQKVEATRKLIVLTIAARRESRAWLAWQEELGKERLEVMRIRRAEERFYIAGLSVGWKDWKAKAKFEKKEYTKYRNSMLAMGMWALGWTFDFWRVATKTRIYKRKKFIAVTTSGLRKVGKLRKRVFLSFWVTEARDWVKMSQAAKRLMFLESKKFDKHVKEIWKDWRKDTEFNLISTRQVMQLLRKVMEKGSQEIFRLWRQGAQREHRRYKMISNFMNKGMSRLKRSLYRTWMRVTKEHIEHVSVVKRALGRCIKQKVAFVLYIWRQHNNDCVVRNQYMAGGKRALIRNIMNKARRGFTEWHDGTKELKEFRRVGMKVMVRWKMMCVRNFWNKWNVLASDTSLRQAARQRAITRHKKKKLSVTLKSWRMLTPKGRDAMILRIINTLRKRHLIHNECEHLTRILILSVILMEGLSVFITNTGMSARSKKQRLLFRLDTRLFAYLMGWHSRTSSTGRRHL